MADTLTLVKQSIEQKISLTEKIQDLIKKCDEAANPTPKKNYSPLNS